MYRLETRVWALLAVWMLTPCAWAAVNQADFGAAVPSPAARRIANWAVDSNDHGGRPFAIIDKPRARLYVFGADGKLRGDAPVLLGSARGDDTVSGIGEREFSQIQPHERTTPAGRFVTEAGRNLRGEDVIWIDYEAAVSMHPVLTTNPAERRLQRLATPTAQDNRISYGCVNVPTRFFQQVVLHNLRQPKTVVYVLPDVKPLQRVFGHDDTAERARRGTGNARVQPAASPRP